MNIFILLLVVFMNYCAASEKQEPKKQLKSSKKNDELQQARREHAARLVAKAQKEKEEGAAKLADQQKSKNDEIARKLELVAAQQKAEEADEKAKKEANLAAFLEKQSNATPIDMLEKNMLLWQIKNRSPAGPSLPGWEVIEPDNVGLLTDKGWLEVDSVSVLKPYGDKKIKGYVIHYKKEAQKQEDLNTQLYSIRGRIQYDGVRLLDAALIPLATTQPQEAILSQEVQVQSQEDLPS